jgi:mannose-6-phosphate isomerase
MASHKPQRLAGRAFEKIWGSTHLEPWFRNPAEKIGEVWFAEGDSPVLIKFLFTTENLSVQVHPNDAQARSQGGRRGKTEMWHILRAEPGARIALGLNQPATPAELRRALLDGGIMDMLRWFPARPGDTWFVPAGAIHAIGAGIALCEVQQHSDITYRLYDYGRPRELHLDRGIAVADPAFHAEEIPRTFVDCPYFRVESIRLSGVHSLVPRPGTRNMLVATHGAGVIAGEPFGMGEVWMLPEGAAIELAGDAQLLHVTG